MTAAFDELAEQVLLLVDLIPAGRVVSYGDIADLLTESFRPTSARQVGAVMSREGSGVAWWRVTNAAGALPDHLIDEARARWADEGVGWKPGRRGCRIQAHRADLPALAAAYDAATRPD
ncbi:MAG: MGMT family protein [Nocardioides sp.]